jgi:hypothetical protein
MSDPYFWARRVADDSWRPLTDFGASTTEDTGSPPLSVSGITPGQYKITVSDGQNAIKTNEIVKAKRDAVGRDFSPVVNAKIAFSQSNPSVKVGGTDYAASEIEEGDLEADVGSGDGTVETFYDQAGSNDLTAPSQSEEPTIVSSGTLVTDSNGDPAISLSDSQQLTRSRSSGPVTIGGVIDPGNDDEDFAYVNGLSLSSDGTDLRAHVNEAVVSEDSQAVAGLSSEHRGIFNLGGTLYRFVRPDGTDTAMYEWTGSSWTEVLGQFEGSNAAGGTDDFPIAYNDKIYVGNASDLWAWGPSDGSSGFQAVDFNFLPSGAGFRAKYVYNGTLYLHDNDSDPGVTTYDGNSLSRSDPGTSEVFVQDAIIHNGRAYLMDGDSGTVQVKSWIPGDTASWINEITVDDPNEFYTYNGDLYLTTDTSLEKYDGSSWSTVSTPFGGEVESGIEADEVMWVIAETTAGQDDWKLYIYNGQIWRSFTDPVEAGSLFSQGTFEVIYNSEVFYFLTFNDGYTAQASYTPRNRSTTVSVPLPSGAFSAVAGTDGSTVALRAGGQESTATYSFSRNDKAGVEVGNTGGTIRHYVEFDTLLSQSNRSSLESALGSI